MGNRLWVFSDSFAPCSGLPAPPEHAEGAQPRLTLIRDKGLSVLECCCPVSPCEAESRGSDWLPVTSHSWHPFSPDTRFTLVPHFTAATRHNRKQMSRAVPSTPISGFFTASLWQKSVSTSVPWASRGIFPTRVIAVGGADFVFYLICCLYGTAIGMTNSHNIAMLGSNYLKTNSFPESSSLFSLHPSLSLFLKKKLSQQERNTNFL